MILKVVQYHNITIRIFPIIRIIRSTRRIIKTSLDTIEGSSRDFTSMIDILIALQRNRKGARFLNKPNSVIRANRSVFEDKIISTFPHHPPSSEDHRD